MTAGVTSIQAAELPDTYSSLQGSIGGLDTGEERDKFGQSGEQLSNSDNSSSSSVTVTSSSSSSEAKPESGAPPASTEVRGSSTASLGLEPQTRELDSSSGTSEAGGRLVKAEVHASLENGEKEPQSPSSDDKGADSEWRSKEEEEDDDDEDGSRKEDYSEGDLVDISAYSGLGEEDSGGSQLDEEEDEDEDEEEEEEVYQPESSCSEIPGLPAEEEPAPPSRKICFSTEPIKVRKLLLA